MAQASINISDGLLIKDSRPYVLWRRVSTVGQGESGLGLEAQLTIARLFTKREPVEIFTDVYSGTKLMECENLWRAIEYCKENNAFLVIAKTDRFRNVKEALEVLDAVGDGNLSFCDMPTVNRMILTILFSVWEAQATMGRINTKMALMERRRQLEEQGGWVSKSGRWTTHFGREKGSDISAAIMASAAKSHQAAQEWRENSVGWRWVKRQVGRGIPRKEIIEEFNSNYELGMQGFCTSTGKPMTKAILSLWIKEMSKTM